MSREPSDGLQIRLALLSTSDGGTDEQRRAEAIARRGCSSVDTVGRAGVRSDGALDKYDVVWWHAPTPLEDGLGSELADTLEAYVRSGGCLLLSLYALTAVDSLGVDPHCPDRVEDAHEPNQERTRQPSGFLVKSRFADEPPFEEFDSLRIHTQPSYSKSVPRVTYDRRVPKHGTILASAVVGGEDKPGQNSVIGWKHGEGTVLGIGQGFSFEEGVPAFELELTALLEGLFRYGGSETVSRRPFDRETLSKIRRTVGTNGDRPTYHFTPPANWLNDPNGVIQWDGEYHLFYQYNPAGPYHGSIHWGHAVSSDLVHWEDRPVALTPEMGGPDRDGCWSGCAVVDDGQPAILYTGGDGKDQLPCLARAREDALTRWKKHPNNPVINSPPDDAILSNDDWNAEFRDHNVWSRDGTWYHLIGSGFEDAGGAVLLYRSDDLLDWEYCGPALVGDRAKTGPMWECPDLLRFEDKHLLQVSNYDEVIGFLGRFDGEQFDVDRSLTIDHGNYYAAHSVPGGDRYLSWGWIREDRPQHAQWDAGWSGAMSVPRSVSLDPDGNLQLRPATELTALRSDHTDVEPQTLGPDEGNPLDAISGKQLELDLDVELETATAFRVGVRESPDGAEQTTIRYDGAGSVTLDRRQSSTDDGVTTTPQSIESVPGAEDGRIRLRILLDASVIELFANDRRSLSSRIYPTRSDSTGISCAAVGGKITLHSCDVWSVDSIGTERQQQVTTRSTEGVRE
jgi:beta-fructofuranosidase